MAGRNDFGILRSSFLTDHRAHRTATLFAERGLATPDHSFAAVCGYVVMLGLWAMKETDDGVLPGDGIRATLMASAVPVEAARQVVQAFLDGGLLRPTPDAGLYLVGWRDCYDPIRERRAANAEANRLAREEARIEREERQRRLEERRQARKGRDASSSPVSVTGKHDCDAYPSGPTVPAVPAVPDRNGTAGCTPDSSVGRSASPAPASAGAAFAGPASAVGSQRNGHGSERPAGVVPRGEFHGTEPPAVPARPEVIAAVKAQAAALGGGRVAGPLAELRAGAAATEQSRAIVDAEREQIRLGQRLAEIEEVDGRHEEAQALLAERPRGSDWSGRAERVLAGEPW